MNNLRKTGGVAAVVLGLLFIALIALLATVAGQGYNPGSGNDPDKALAFASISPMPYVIYALYIAIAGALILIVLALYNELGDRARDVTRLAVVAGAVGGALFLA